MFIGVPWKIVGPGRIYQKYTDTIVKLVYLVENVLINIVEFLGTMLSTFHDAIRRDKMQMN